ncbi:MAG: hypothetical protein PHF67_04925 [Candidatus Nanoarchaeia archaeon]|nr:hypothetical protein [Candidatus Nanoarchaeia archaeon]
MVSVIECLRETWLNDLLIGLVIYTGLSLCLIIILILIIFKMLNKDKSTGEKPNEQATNNG